MERKYLSDDGVIDFNELEKGKMNLIVAPCGSGKTTFVEKKLYKCPSSGNILYLVDSKNGLTAFKGRGKEMCIYAGEVYYVHKRITAMTYAGFAKYCSCNPNKNLWNTEDSWIVCDEMQSVIKWQKIKSENEEETNLHKLALDLIHERIDRGATVIAITATPNLLRKEFGNKIYDLPIHAELNRYEVKEVIYYQNLMDILTKLPADKYGLIYVPRITKMLEVKQALEERGISVACVWSINNENHKMEDKDKRVRTEIIEKEMISEDVQVTIINAASETGLNIKSRIDYVVVHSTNEDTVIQAIGRVRHDVDEAYLLTQDGHDMIIELPDMFLNKYLNKKMKEQLCEFLNLKNEKGRLMKWTSIKSILIESGYSIYDSRKDDIRYSIIRGSCV